MDVTVKLRQNIKGIEEVEKKITMSKLFLSIINRLEVF